MSKIYFRSMMAKSYIKCGIDGETKQTINMETKLILKMADYQEYIKGRMLKYLKNCIWVEYTKYGKIYKKS